MASRWRKVTYPDNEVHFSVQLNVTGQGKWNACATSLKDKSGQGDVVFHLFIMWYLFVMWYFFPPSFLQIKCYLESSLSETVVFGEYIEFQLSLPAMRRSA